jgi:cytochrome c
MPPKKKVAGDPGKGEKVFKNLCAVCHSMSVSTVVNLSSHIQLGPL